MSETTFLLWWEHTGRRLTKRAALYPSEALVRDICRIAYFQGEVDAHSRTIAEIPEPPPDVKTELLLP